MAIWIHVQIIMAYFQNYIYVTLVLILVFV